MPRKAIIQWGISSFFGWGVYGLNLALHWSADPEIEPLCSLPLHPEAIVVDGLRRLALESFYRESAAFQAQLARFAGAPVAADRPLLVALGNDFMTRPAAHDAGLTGRPTIGVTFFETAQLAPQAIERAKAFDLIVAGSTWNADVLREHGVERVRTVLQGIDPTLFHPAPAAGMLADRFLIFSGGKLERRKGQDIVLAAFKIFAERHPEALLVTAWHSPWPAFARTLDQSGLAAPMVFDASGRPDIKGWARASFIAPERVIDLGAVPNALMPPILREVDAAVFPNRAEGGTNLIAIECMACGVPVILSRNTGHLDLIEDDNCYPLREQRSVAGEGAGIGAMPGWGESSVEELVEALERVFADRAEAGRRSARGAAKLASMSWAKTAAGMKQLVLNIG